MRPDSGYLTRSSANDAPDAAASVLRSLGLSEADARKYVDGLREGHALEAVTVDDDKAPEAIRIMKDHIIGARRREAGAEEGLSQSEEDVLEGEVVIPIFAEELIVGKRVEEKEAARVHTRVEELPVEQNVTLREERVEVERRPANRALTEEEAADAFGERTVEVVAKGEEPVIGKRAFLIEEIVLKKDVDTRTEKIEDTVRKTEVDIDELDREHFNRRYASPGADYDTYSPAYRFGHGMHADSQFQGGDWNEVEPKAQRAWEDRNPGTWERVTDAVRDAWERAKR